MEIAVSPTVINILIVDDHTLLRNGLKMMLGLFRKELHLVVLEAESGELALNICSREQIDFVIVDYQMQTLSGPETVRRLLRFTPDLKILALSNHAQYQYIREMMEAGCSGYVLKSIQSDQLLLAIKTILTGKKFFCNEVALILLEKEEDISTDKKLSTLRITSREQQVWALIAAGKTSIEIGKELFAAPRTIDKHRQSLLAKLHVKNTASLVKLAIKFDL